MKEKHGDQKRKEGTLYYTHPMAVYEMLKERGFGVDFWKVGLFHDLIEDTDVTYEDIKKISSVEIADAVRLLSKEEGYDIGEYFQRISENYLAKMVKLADRVHNLSKMHLASIEFQKKYINETNKWFSDLARDTVFEKDIQYFLDKYREYLN